MKSKNLEPPQVWARVAGVMYLLIIATGAFGEIFVRGTLFVSGDPSSTAANIAASESLWRIGIAGDILQHVFDIPVMLALYLILNPVNKNLARLAILFNLIQTAVLVANSFNLIMPLFLVGNAEYLKAFAPNQIYVWTQLFVRLHSYGFGVGLVFFGLTCLVIGYLIFKSGYLPRILGILMMIAGLCYLTNSLALLLAPTVAAVIVPAILLPALVAELSLALWLVIKGIRVEAWKMRVVEFA
ncbi:DUF4386 domain-containing protein [Anaerolineae bacterium CFX7]|nr:DUF4386 domain-containing protein [Anaerolineae bacterium CFX7]